MSEDIHAKFVPGLAVSRPYVFTRQNIAEYARIAGDTNPLHLEPDVAGTSRFGRIIACAAHSTGVLVSVLAAEFSAEGRAVGLGFSFKLRRAVHEGADTELVWRITGREASPKLGGDVLTLDGEVRDRQTGSQFVTAEGRLLLLPAVASTTAESIGRGQVRLPATAAEVP